MNCIKWIKAGNELPPIDIDDNYKFKNKISVRVLVSFHNREGINMPVAFATYHRAYELWLIEGYNGKFTITHYAEINKPLNY